MKQSQLCVVVAMALVWGAPPVAVALADDGVAGSSPVLLADNGDRDMDRDRDRVMDRLHADLGLSDGERQRLNERVRHHLENGGTEQSLRQVMQVALRNGCRDRCLEDAVRAVNRDMHQGASVMQARSRVEKAIRYVAEHGDSKGMADRLRDRLELRERDNMDSDRPMRDRDSGMGGGMGGGRR